MATLPRPLGSGRWGGHIPWSPGTPSSSFSNAVLSSGHTEHTKAHDFAACERCSSVGGQRRDFFLPARCSFRSLVRTGGVFGRCWHSLGAKHCSWATCREGIKRGREMAASPQRSDLKPSPGYASGRRTALFFEKSFSSCTETRWLLDHMERDGRKYKKGLAENGPLLRSRHWCTEQDPPASHGRSFSLNRRPQLKQLQVLL